MGLDVVGVGDELALALAEVDAAACAWRCGRLWWCPWWRCAAGGGADELDVTGGVGDGVGDPGLEEKCDEWERCEACELCEPE
jgi:hypothetical protein